MDYHPAGTIILKSTSILRSRVLPSHVYGEVTVDEGDEVMSNKVVAHGVAPQAFRIIDVAKALNIRPDDVTTLAKVIRVQAGDAVEAGAPLAKARRRRERRYIPLAPADGVVSVVEHGRIILSVNPEPIEIYARIPGIVSQLIGEDNNRGVLIRSQGALMQCAWGNGKFAFGAYSFEPEAGLASLRNEDSLLNNLRGRVYILERAIEIDDLHVVLEKGLGGLVATSMPYHLRETAMMLKVPIILTEGFGKRNPSVRVYEILREFEKEREGAFDASLPDHRQQIQPEIVLPLSLRSQSAGEPNFEKALKVGMSVRLRRLPHDGQVAQITQIPEALQVIENGLRVPAAQVKLKGGKYVVVPLANLQLMGDS